MRNIERKERDNNIMAESMLAHMRDINRAEIHGTIRETNSYEPKAKIKIPAFLNGGV